RRVQVVQPPAYFPYGTLDRVPALARRVIGTNAKRYARFVEGAVGAAKGARSLVLMNSFMPVHGYLVGPRLRPSVHLYHRADDLAAYSSCRPVYIDLERDVLRQADVVVCVSAAVRAAIAGDRPDARIVANGVDNARFTLARPDPRLSGLARPVAVLVGTVDGRVDRALLDSVVDSGATLVVAGKVLGGDETLPPGTVSLGAVEPDAIPGILAGADVGLVPYDPRWPGDVLKTYEYLAAGLPVVATPLPCLDGIDERLVRRATHADFGRAVMACASSDTPARREQRRAAAREQDWSARVDAMLALMSAAVAA
ncbi:MAG: teichuronic acid biosynthesis glycosyltransferase TuaH, partial [Acidimicrobiaceae bacterium]|nr:teichuronic acid biosynthesis glycosyltransferase TuaH [Acidimicrobiaceae bacterium]